MFSEVPQTSGELSWEENKKDQEQRWETERKEKQEQRQREQEEARERELQELERLEMEMVMIILNSVLLKCLFLTFDIFMDTKKRQLDEMNIDSICV